MQAAFYFDAIPVYTRVILAPMDGISDLPFRLICKKFGSGLIFSEFINALDVPGRLGDFHKRTRFTDIERPFGFQIYGSDVNSITNASILLERLNPDFIDLNLGCSVRRIVHRGAGAGLLKKPNKVKQLIKTLKTNISIPLSVKIRLGWNSSQLNYHEIALISEGEGAGLITVHARTREQSYKERAEWNAIADVKNAVNIPVIGNGDVFNQNEIISMLSETGCDGVMVGRGALGNPWIFSDRKKTELSRKEIMDIVIEHWTLMIACFGAEQTNIRFRKHLKAYLNCSQFSNIDISSIMRAANPINQMIISGLN